MLEAEGYGENSLSFAVNAVNNLITASLNKKHYKQQLVDVHKFINDFGVDCERQVYRTLFSTLLQTPYNDSVRLGLLQQLYVDLGPLFDKPDFESLLRFAFRQEPGLSSSEEVRAGQPSSREGLLADSSPLSGALDGATSRRRVNDVLEVAKLLKLSETEKLASLVCLHELGACDREVDLGKCTFSASSSLTHYLLSQLSNSIDQKANDLGKRIQDELCEREFLDSSSSQSPFVFLSTTFNPNFTMDTILSGSISSLSDDQVAGYLVSEGGVQLSSDVVRQFNVTPKLCAKLLFAICDLAQHDIAGGVQRGNEDIEALANICREFLPSASPLADIIRAIDSDEFSHINKKVISSSVFGKPFERFWRFCLNLCNTDKQGISILGILFFSKLWSHNVEFQFGFVVNCIKNQLVSKLLSVGPGGPTPGTGKELGAFVLQLESLKCQPDVESNSDLNTWKYQQVYQILVDVSLLGNPSSTGTEFFLTARELLKWPIQNCPDLVALGILGCSGGYSIPKEDFLKSTISSFLSNHPNAAIILHTIWNLNESPATTSPSPSQWAKQALLQAMCDYYKNSSDEQQQRLSRILDVAQDLKALNLLLNSNHYPFVIDLACLASRREYLKLDKWVLDKIQNNGEQFVKAAVEFLQRRCAPLANAKNLEPGAPFACNPPPETLATLLSCLNHYAVSSTVSPPSQLSKELSDTILNMVANSSLLLKGSRTAAVGGTGSLQTSKASQPASSQSIGDLGLSNLSITSQAGNFNQNARTPFGAPVGAPPGVGLGTTMSRLPGVAAAGSAQANQQDRLRAAVGDLANIFPDMNQNVSPEIEKEADTYFQKIYNQSSAGSMSIDDVLDMLRRFQDSTATREKEVFTCMIRNLFKEYCYFPQYPDKELLITAQLFGGIIQLGLVKYMALVVALRYVLEALRKPYTSKMYYFGIAALDRFKTKLKDYPLYCQHLASIQHFKDFPSHLIDYIEYGGQSQEPPNRIGASSTPPPVSIGGPSSAFGIPAPNVQQASQMPKPAIQPIGNSLGASTTAGNPPGRPSIVNAANINTLLAETTTWVAPPEATIDKVAFIINNLSQVNLPQKTEEFKEVIGKDEMYHGWIAQYFVMKRVSIEINFHTLYANFLEVLRVNELSQLIIRETLRNIKVLLRSEIANYTDRSLLKNLGHWLGMLTLAKSRPILAIELNVKNLLIEAYHKGTQDLLNVVPFIAKILDSCADSKVFKPPNPWTMGILKALVELHQVPNLKLSLKFEVEVLCKALSEDVSELIGKSAVFSDEMLRLRVLAEPQLGGGRSHTIPAASVPAPSLPLPSPFTPGPGREPALGPSLVQPPGGFTDFPANSPPSLMQPFPGAAGMGNSTTAMIPTQAAHAFNYHDINTSSITGLAPHILISNSLPLWQLQPNLKQFVKPAIERAVQEWLQPVVERSIKISIPTAEQIIKKDFALESDEGKMCVAAHFLIRNLTAGMAMITSKETLFGTITTTLAAAFMRNSSANVAKEQLEATANAIASDNIDLACCFIQKTAVDKAIPELDKRLQNDYDCRRKARNEGRRFCDPGTLTYQAERMPEAIRLKVGSVTNQQFAIYEDIGRNIPGFVSPVNDPPNPAHSGQRERPPISAPTMPSGPGYETSDTGLVNLYDKLVTELETLLQQFVQNCQPAILAQTMSNILDTVMSARTNTRDIVGALALIQRVLDALHELIISAEHGMVDMVLITRARDLYLVILKALADPRAYGHQWTTKQITRLVLERLLSQSSPSSPLPDELFDILMRSGLINLMLMDHNLAQLIESAQSSVALAFTLQFVKIYGQAGLQETEIQHIIAALLKLGKAANAPNLTMEIQQVLEVFRGSSVPSYATEPPAFPFPASRLPARSHPSDPSGDVDDPEFMEKTERLLREWIAMYHSTTNLSKVFQMYVQSMNQHGILKTDDSITRFFRLSTELCVEFCYRILSGAPQQQNNQTIIETRNKCFQTLDAFAHLIVMLVKHSGTNTAVATESSAKLNLLNKVLNIVAGVAIQDQDARNESFQHLPYYRIFIILFMELTLGPNNLGLPAINSMQMGFGNNPQLDPLYESIQFQVLSAFCQTLRVLKPGKVPSFAYAWLDFISHRTFMEKCLNSPAGGFTSGTPVKGWPLYAQLLVEIIKFLAPFLRSVELSPPVDNLYKGTLKVLLVLLHDFPEFLCEYCYDLCDSIPCNAIQMRNLVLSAFPRNMRLPDPFTPNLKIDSLPEITNTPKGSNSMLAALANVPFKKDLESYLRTRSPVTFLSELRGDLQQMGTTQQVDTTRYNIPLINALVLYVGQMAIQTITPKHINMTTIAHSSHMDIFQNLAVDLDTEGRYLFLNAIANQLRYPNSYTHYFSCTLLYLFAESNTEAIQEQITRVLLERLIVNRPHPWGLLVTFIELIKNPAFKFWNHEFVRCAPEIEKLFESVAKSCMQNQPKQLAGNVAHVPGENMLGGHNQSVN